MVSESRLIDPSFLTHVHLGAYSFDKSSFLQFVDGQRKWPSLERNVDSGVLRELEFRLFVSAALF